MLRIWYFFIALNLLLFCLIGNEVNATVKPSNDKNMKKIAVIIDDFGGDVKGVKQFLTSNIPITVAIMPFMAQTKKQAELAHENGLEVIVHLPLQPKKGKASWLGPNAITSNLSDEEVKQKLNLALDDVPFAVGINNHMGSLIVENERIMRIILEIAKERHLFVIDSGTSPKSVIPKLCKELGIPYAVRDIFLDDSFSSSKHVYQQMTKLVKVAEKKGKAIGIGHVGIKGEATVRGVKSSLPLLKEKKVEIVPVSELLSEQYNFFERTFPKE